MDWNNIWGQAKESVSNAWDQAVQNGTPVIKASIEKWAIDTIQKQHEQTKEELQQVVGRAVDGPDTATGQVLKQAFFKEYQTAIIGSVIALVAIGYLMKGAR